MTEILRLEITSFGALSGKTAEFHSGLNDIVLPNESGKSTVTDFIIFILYGFVKTAAKRVALEDNLLKKYLPWDGGTELSGAMELNIDGSRVRVERRQNDGRKNTVQMYDAGGAPIAFEDSPGRHIFGVDRETFVRTYLIRQTDIRFDSTDGLVSALKNLVTTGDEDFSFESAMEILRKKHRAYRHIGRNGGRMFELQRQITETQLELGSLHAQMSQIGDLTSGSDKQQLEQCEKRLESLAGQLELARGADAYRRMKEITDAKSELDSVSAALSELVPQETDGEYERRLSEAQAEKQRILNAKPRSFALPLMLSGAACMLLSALGAVFAPLLAFAAAGAVLLVLGLLRLKKERAYSLARTAAEKRVSSAAAECDAENQRRKTEYEKQRAVLAERKENAQRRYDRLVRGTDVEALAAAARQGSELTAEQVNEQIAAQEHRKSELTSRISENAERARRYNELARRAFYLESQLPELKEKLERAEYADRVYTLAEAALDKAHGVISNMYAPILTECAGAPLSALTDGRYCEVFLDRDFELRVKTRDGLYPLGYFSRGTADSVYFSMRMSVCDLISDKKNLPLVMDDPFWSLDDRRLENAKKYVENAAKERQIILFSARK